MGVTWFDVQNNIWLTEQADLLAVAATRQFGSDGETLADFISLIGLDTEDMADARPYRVAAKIIQMLVAGSCDRAEIEAGAVSPALAAALADADWFQADADILPDTLEALMADAAIAQYGEYGKEPLTTFLMCQGFEMRFLPAYARAHRLAAMIISRAAVAAPAPM